MINANIVNIVCAGVGGQGILFASKVISELAFLAGLDVKTNEVHGMAQRGGSVISQVRYGRKIYSPLIQKGTADFLLGMEKLEVLRFADYLKPDGLCIVSDTTIMPPSVSSGIAEYPKDINELIKKTFKKFCIVPAENLSDKTGDRRTSNTILLGALSCYLNFDDKLWDNAINNVLHGKNLEINKKAFLIGKEYLECSGIKK